MRFFKIWTAALFVTGAGLAAGQSPDAYKIAATWHFGGASHLAGNPSCSNLTTMLTLQSSIEFRHLVLDRFAAWLPAPLDWVTNGNAAKQVRPLLDDLLSAESYGGWANPRDFGVAVQLDDARSLFWQEHLRQALGGPGESFKAGDYPGTRWHNAGGVAFWMFRAKGWTVAGRGDILLANFLMQMGRQGRPGPALAQDFFDADVDWPLVVGSLPASPFPFKPARTKIALAAQTNQLVALRATVHYPQPIAWKSEPWRVPYDLIRSPLTSFTAGQDIAAYMTPGEPLSRLTANPLAGQFYVWAMSQIGLQTFSAWPVPDATNALQNLVQEAPAAFNPDLARLQAGELTWKANFKALTLSKAAPFLAGQLQVAPETNGQYLLASLFPLDLDQKPAPAALYQQFIGRTNLVYYDWEGTALRLDQWRLLAGLLPLFPKTILGTNDLAYTNLATAAHLPKPPVLVVENWLVGLKPMLLKNTVTEVTRTAPDELAVARKSPLGVTGLELVVFSHWLTGAGSTGLMPSLLPPAAKETGPGMPPAP